MDRSERFYRIDQLLNERGVVTREAFLEELEVSLATFKRDLEYMRDRYNAPVVYDADAGGYRFDKQPDTGPRYALPGLWFSESEALALLTMEHLLSSLDDGGLIGPHIAPLRARLMAILGTGEASAAEVRKRIRSFAHATSPPARMIPIAAEGPKAIWRGNARVANKVNRVAVNMVIWAI